MSLKAFHIVFVALTMLLSVSFGAWAARDYRASGSAASLCASIGSFLAVPLLLVYGRWFLRKLKNVSYL